MCIFSLIILSIFNFAPFVCFALEFTGARVTGIVRPRLAFAVDHAEIGEVFDFLANSAAFGTIWHAVDSRQIPWKIWLF